MEQLYIINRYYGDDDGEQAQVPDGANHSDALAKLIAKAKQREAEENKADDIPKGKNKRVRESDRIPSVNSETFDVVKKEQEDDEDISTLPKSKKSKKNPEHEYEGGVDFEDLSNETQAKQSAKKKTKIKKKKVYDNEVTNEQASIGNGEIGSDTGVDVLNKDAQLALHSSSPSEKSAPKRKRHKKNEANTKASDAKDTPEIRLEVQGMVQADNESSPLNEDGDETLLNENGIAQSDQLLDADISSTKEVAGFTILGRVQETKKTKVKRVLPEWLSNPTIVTADLHESVLSIDDMAELDGDLISRLRKQGITSFFPVQKELIPWILNENTYSHCRRPRDVCVSAPTGSGKTLAFVLPVIQCLRTRVVCSIRALVVLPVNDLAVQVFDVFQKYCAGTSLKVALLSGHQLFAEEQASLVRQGPRGPLSLVDIVVSTPGRLVDHIHNTPGFSLKQLRFLIIDEADRMLEEVGHMWLQEVQKAVFAGHVSTAVCQCSKLSMGERAPDLVLTTCGLGRVTIPFQKLLFSATLSQDPEKLEELSLFRPKLFTSVVKRGSKNFNTQSLEVSKDTRIQGEYIGKYTTPDELKEYITICLPELKPLTIWYFIECKKFRRVLCFTGSIQNTHRLYLILKQIPDVTVAEFSSKSKTKLRKNILKKFAAGEIDVLVCSDIMARGMDVENVDYVISYDPTPYVKSYIHRIGRTARAGREGTAITLVHQYQLKPFMRMINSSGRKKPVKKMAVRFADLKPLEEKYRLALAKVSELVQEEHKKKYIKRSTGLGKQKA